MRIRHFSIASLLALVAQQAAGRSTASPPVLEPTERLEFDRPEAWVLKHFDSATVLSGLETPRTRRFGRSG